MNKESIPSLHPDLFRVRREGEETRVIEVIPGQVVTRACREKVSSQGNWVISDPGIDGMSRAILKMAVVERHRGSGRIGLGLVDVQKIRDCSVVLLNNMEILR
jgi:adenine deaminase